MDTLLGSVFFFLKLGLRVEIPAFSSVGGLSLFASRSRGGRGRATRKKKWRRSVL